MPYVRSLITRAGHTQLVAEDSENWWQRFQDLDFDYVMKPLVYLPDIKRKAGEERSS